MCQTHEDYCSGLRDALTLLVKIKKDPKYDVITKIRIKAEGSKEIDLSDFLLLPLKVGG